MSRIASTFETLKSQQRAALMPYITVGYPNLDTTEALIPVLVENGADMVELGIPYSDPLADGPTIQRAGQAALKGGVNITAIHDMVHRLRKQGLQAPIVYMVYYNCVYRHGEERFLSQAAQAGVDGLIIPDLPLEEAEHVETLAKQHNMDLIYLLAPTSTPERIRLTAQRARGFIYCVSVTGVTGARDSVSDALQPLLDRIRPKTDVPLAVGFGISTPEQARTVASMADGVIVGSALIDQLDEAADRDDACQRAGQYMYSLRQGMDKSIEAVDA